MAPFFFSIHREHFIRACVCVWRLLFSCAESGLCPSKAVQVRARARAARCAVPPQPLCGAREPRDPRCLDSAFARPRALGRGIIFDALDSAQGEVKRIKPHPYASSSMLVPSWSLARPTHHLSKALRQPSAAAHRGRPPSSRAAPRRAGARARRWPRCAPAWGAAAAGAACWSHQGAGSLAGG